MADKKSFILYLNYKKQFNKLSDEQAGKLIKSIFSYAENQIVPEFDDAAIDMAFSFIEDNLTRDIEKWENTRKKRVEAGRKGGKQKQANASSAKQEQENLADLSNAKQSLANQAVNVNGNVNVNDNIPPIVPQGDKSVLETNSLEKSFDIFWKAYPNRASKSNALKAWKKLKPNDDLVRIILNALEKQRQSSQWQKENGRFIPYASKWINEKRWEDEVCVVNEKKYSFNLEDYEAFTNDFGDD